MKLEDIIKALKDSEDLRKGVAEYSFQTEEGKTILSNFLKTQEGGIVERANKAFSDKIQSLFKDVGFEPGEGEGLNDFLKSVASKYKELSSKGDGEEVSKLKAKIKEMQESGELNQHFKKEAEELKRKLHEQTEAHKEEIGKKEKEFYQTKIKAEVNSGLNSLDYNKDDKAVSALISVLEQKLIDGAYEVDGKIIFKKDESSDYRNASYEPLTTNEIWKQELEPYIKKGDGGNGGAGAGRHIDDKGDVSGNGDKTKLVLNNNSFSTKEEFSDVAEKTLIAKGIDPYSTEGERLIDNAYSEYNIDNLK